MYENVTSSILRLGNFSEQQLSEIYTRMSFLNMEKGQILLSEGEVCRTFYFVSKGSFRQWTILDSGVEATVNFFIENDWILDHKSFLSQSPSLNTIQAAESSEVYGLTAHDFHELVKISDSFFRLGKIFENSTQNQGFQNNHLSPEERYELLILNKPEIIQKFPLKQVASFLGIAPETLSRIRRKISS